MPTDYRKLHRENLIRYGTEINRFGPPLLSERYDDRTHFIFELLQNAEDALARREYWKGSRMVDFRLTRNSLRVSHFGQPFGETDVRGVCGIAESTKDKTSIGRFGIGFKSVYAFTNRPAIHSGKEAFAIENFVRPVAVEPIDHGPDETVILIPLKKVSESEHNEIIRGLEMLGAPALRFLRQIETITWSVEDGRSGSCIREEIEIEPNIRRVTVKSREKGQQKITERWLVFSREVTRKNGEYIGHVEIAFALLKDKDTKSYCIRRIESSPLIVFFPTILETHLGFLVQGPYTTTPSRDNVPSKDKWNQYLVLQTAALLKECLPWLRDNKLLDTETLRCLPINPDKFGQSNMFASLYETTKSILLQKRLLPRSDQGHVLASLARLGRTKELREIFTKNRLAQLYGEKPGLAWLSGEITSDRTPDLRLYLTQELKIPEITPEIIVRNLNQVAFLEAQSDKWIRKLYKFLNRQRILRHRCRDLPLVRLENGQHVRPYLNGEVQAFLPSSETNTTSFPVVRSTLCTDKNSLDFLKVLGLTECDPVEDVLRHVLPKYQQAGDDVDELEYEADIGRILNSFATDSMTKRKKLIDALKESYFVMAVNFGDGTRHLTRPNKVYLPTERLRSLFEGVDGVLFVDNERKYLQGEGIRSMLEACGISRSLQADTIECCLSSERLTEIRREHGFDSATWESRIPDKTLRGLDAVLTLLPRLDVTGRRQRTKLLWKALVDVESRQGQHTFVTKYTWGYYRQERSAVIDADFVRKLQETKWIPDSDGNLVVPEVVDFDTLSWEPDAFLLSKIQFKPPIIDQLAEKAGFEPGALDFLRKIGATSEAEIRKRFGVKDEDGIQDDADTGGNRGVHSDLSNQAEQSVNTVESNSFQENSILADSQGKDSKISDGLAKGVEMDASIDTGDLGDSRANDASHGMEDVTATSGRRQFKSYISVHSGDEKSDPDGLAQAARMELEAKAIDAIISVEPQWQRTPPNNPGFDLYEIGPDGQPVRWCEVKAMATSLSNRPVSLSRKQFNCARKYGDSYCLYIVERAGKDNRRIVRIRNPEGNADNFTFDDGWLAIAEVVGP